MVRGIFCLNTECKHYFEDNCIHIFEKDTITVDENGKCETFEKGINLGYQAPNDNEHEAAETTQQIIKADTRTMAIELINKERDRQDSKWGEQNHPPCIWTGILGEEYGEYCEAVNETVFDNGEEARKLGGYNNMMTELTHVAAVAVGAMEALMRAKARGEYEDKEAEPCKN